jgi:hypothetical protein
LNDGARVDDELNGKCVLEVWVCLEFRWNFGYWGERESEPTWFGMMSGLYKSRSVNLGELDVGFESSLSVYNWSPFWAGKFASSCIGLLEASSVRCRIQHRFLLYWPFHQHG